MEKQKLPLPLSYISIHSAVHPEDLNVFFLILYIKNSAEIFPA